MVMLSKLVEQLGGELRGTADVAIRDVHVNSRLAQPGTLFVALPGLRVNGAEFALDALQRGAVAVLAPTEIQGLPPEAALWSHAQARSVAGHAAALVYDNPGSSQVVIGVTGTNGKSTVVHLLGSLLRAAGRRPGLIGTVEVALWNAEPTAATHTTPDATELQRLAKRNLELGGDCLVLEVSSHALDQERLAGLSLDLALFTNLSNDHLDYHSDMDSYAEAKEGIFALLKPGGGAVINVDNEYAERMQRAAERSTSRVVTYGVGSRADLFATLTEADPRGTHLFLSGMGILRTGYFISLVGRHNVENALAAIAAVLLLEASPPQLAAGLASITAPKGRLEQISTGERGFQVFVDYAHTPDALERVLVALREIMPKAGPSGPARLLCVFGCGGDRDREKRAPMGEVVGRLADLAILTNDNPRDEDPMQIIAAIQAGMQDASAEVWVEADRRKAIRKALAGALPGDVVLIAGKGHETWQLSRGIKLPFEDQQVALEELP